MDAESGYDAESEKSPFTTSDITIYDSAKTKKPCEICGSFANEPLIMTCFKCRETREHTYCARVLLRSVPSIWLCEECRNCSVITLTPVKTANSQEEAMRASQSLRTKVVDNDQTAPSSTTNHQVVDNKDSTQVTPSSKTPNSMEQVVPVVPRIHDQYTTEESSHEPSFPVSVYKPDWGEFPLKLSHYVDLSSDSECD